LTLERRASGVAFDARVSRSGRSVGNPQNVRGGFYARARRKHVESGAVAVVRSFTSSAASRGMASRAYECRFGRHSSTTTD